MAADEMNPKILIVEDKQDSIDLICYFLKPQNYKIEIAMNGEEALEKINQSPPDLILLDIMLPKLNGFQVCERVKKNPKTQFIPIIMITALRELKDKIHGLEVGADDFISKPFENVELLTRVRSLLKQKKYYDELERKNEELKRMDEFKDELAHLIVHDMKNPIFVIQGNLQMMGMGIDKAEADSLNKYIGRIERSTENLLKMVLNLIDISKLETGRMNLNKELVVVNDIVKKCIQKISDSPENETKKISLELSDQIPLTYLDNSLFERVLDNLISFAIANVKPEGRVQINTRFSNNILQCEIKDDGIQIPPKFQETLFNKYSQVEIKNEGYRLGRGLGFTFSKLAVEAHKGSIYIENTDSIGNNFIINIPHETAPLN